MKRHSILILSVALLIGAPNASAQSFLKDKLRKVTSKIEKGVSKKIPKKVKDAAKNVEGVTNDIKGVANDVQSATSVVKGKAINVNHTALFAPMGDPVDPSHGTLSMKLQKPPQDETKQPDWNDSNEFGKSLELDNESLIENYKMMFECVESKYISPTCPASFTLSNLRDELFERLEALNRMVEHYNEAKYEYNNGELEWAKLESDKVASYLARPAYHRLVRSSIEPFFKAYKYNEDNGIWVMDHTKEYFDAHGGYKDAHKAKFTVWDTYPPKN